MTVTVLRCIGCGAVATSQPFLGACIDRRLDLVDGAQHAAAVAVLSALEAAVAERRTLLARLSRAAEWEALRAAARAALRVDPEVVAGDLITTGRATRAGA